MNPDDGPSAGNSLALRNAIASQHPGIVDEIEGAINTLRKLKGIADPALTEPPPAYDDQAALATVEATSALTALPAGANPLSTREAAKTEFEPSLRAEVAILAGGSTFGRYQIVRLLGRGAMGAVYLAYDTQLHRHVAVKTPLLGPDPQVVQRFFREARALAQLRSPYICPIYDAGQIGRIHYLSMAFIEGQPLTRSIAEGKLRTAAEISAVIKKIAQALQKAHDMGIIHRDLKPDNIMIDNEGEPIVMDFGLARRVDDDVQVTLSGVLLGTPAYMSPEQVDGDPRKIGPSSDLYSLGVILYQMLSGRLPFKGSLTSILRQIERDPPPRPSDFNSALGTESLLERVCLKMMAKLPADRYASMAEVVRALDQSLGRQDEPIAKPSAFSRVKAWSTGMFSLRGRTTNASQAIDKLSLGGQSVDPAQETMADPQSELAVRNRPPGSG
jgi:serine/threonine protein kinase